jgi:hypothetical protein
VNMVLWVMVSALSAVFWFASSALPLTLGVWTVP